MYEKALYYEQEKEASVLKSITSNGKGIPTILMTVVKNNLIKLICLVFVYIFSASFMPAHADCAEFNTGTLQSTFTGQGLSIQNVELGENLFFESSYDVLSGSMQDDFTVVPTSGAKQTLRDASANANQTVSLIIKYEEEEPGRPAALALISFFIPGALGTTNVIAESTDTDECKEVHNFNISDPQVSSLFAMSNLDFHFLVNTLGQGPANRLGQKFRVTICQNCSSAPPDTGGPTELEIPGLEPLSSKEEAIENLKRAELLLDKVSDDLAASPTLADKVDDVADSVIDTLSKMLGNLGIDSNAESLGSSAISRLTSLVSQINTLITDLQNEGALAPVQDDLNTVKSLIEDALSKFTEENDNG